MRDRPPEGAGKPVVGLLACQGGFEAHRRALAAIGIRAAEVRTGAELAGVDALVLPGGESTTVMKAIERDGLAGPIARHVRSGRPLLATCAGAIVLDRNHLGLLDVACERNAYGRQLASFEAPLSVEGFGAEPFQAVFIRAPKMRDAGADVEVLATYDGDPVFVRAANVIATTFHPELSGDERVHAMLAAMVGPRPTAPTPRSVA